MKPRPKLQALHDYRWDYLPYGVFVCRDHLTLFNRRYLPIATRWDDGRIELGEPGSQRIWKKPGPQSARNCDNPACPVAHRWHRYHYAHWFYDGSMYRRVAGEQALAAKLETLKAQFLSGDPAFAMMIAAARLSAVVWVQSRKQLIALRTTEDRMRKFPAKKMVEAIRQVEIQAMNQASQEAALLMLENNISIERLA